MKRIILILTLLIPLAAAAQIGDHRNELAVGVNGGYTMSTVGFNPNIPQTQLGGVTGGFTMRYTCEKYFKSICAIVAEVNLTQMGWKENINDVNDQPVINGKTGLAEEYQRQLTYVQVPLLARLGWGRERNGFQFFFQKSIRAESRNICQMQPRFIRGTATAAGLRLYFSGIHPKLQ